VRNPIDQAYAPAEARRILATAGVPLHSQARKLAWFRSSQAWLQHLPTMKKREKQPIFDAKGGFGDP
jgi:hypothetical protein